MEYLEDEFGDIIAKARSGLKTSLEQLAQRTAISVADLRAMEDYRRKPSAEESAALASELRLHAGNLRVSAEESWLPTPWYPDSDSDIEVLRWQMPVGAYSVFCYAIRCRHTDESAIIDTGGQGQRVVDLLKQHQMRPRYLLVTHEHSDHIDGLDLVQSETKAPTIAGKSARVPNADKLQDGDALPFGKSVITAHATPGHTAGCMTFLVGKTAFVGDTLFAGSAGRANYSYQALLDSIYQKILSFDDSVCLFPGHGAVTTVGQEKLHNPFIVQ